jgi:hypothetical protein
MLRDNEHLVTPQGLLISIFQLQGSRYYWHLEVLTLGSETT